MNRAGEKFINRSTNKSRLIVQLRPTRARVPRRTQQRGGPQPLLQIRSSSPKDVVLKPVSMMLLNACTSITPSAFSNYCVITLLALLCSARDCRAGGQKGKLNSRDSGQSMACGPGCDGESQHVRDALRLGHLKSTSVRYDIWVII